jgi:hypothetical protein
MEVSVNTILLTIAISTAQFPVAQAVTYQGDGFIIHPLKQKVKVKSPLSSPLKIQFKNKKSNKK